MALLTPQQITKAGLAPSYSAVSASDTIQVDSVGMFLHVKNAGGTQDIVTLDDSGVTAGGSAATDPTVTVPITTGDRMIYLPPQFTNSATGLVTVTHSFTTSVTCAVLRVV
jgi:hypothetical protein